MPQTPRTSPSAAKSTLQIGEVLQCSSEPDLTKERELDYEYVDTQSRNITKRSKRKRDDADLMTSIDELKSLFTSTMAQQESKFSTIMSTIMEIKNQNESIRKSLDFVSEEYEKLKQSYNLLEKEKRENLLYVQSLESRIDNLERNERAASIELRSVPQRPNENKDELCDLVQNLGNTIKIPIVRNDIRDVFRTKSKTVNNNRPIVVEFGTVVLKEKIMQAIKKYKREQNGTQLTTTSLKLAGSPTTIFISENLTTKNKRLFSLARDFAKTNEHKYCWTSHGYIYIKKNDGMSAVRINCEQDLAKLLKTK